MAMTLTSLGQARPRELNHAFRDMGANPRFR